MDGIPDGWWIADNRGPSFDKPGGRLFFETRAKPEPEPEEDEDADDDEPEVRVDIWHWQDDRMMPQQLLQANRDRNRSYLAVRHADGSILQLEDEELDGLNLGRDRVLDIGVANDDAPYQLQSSWGQGCDDIYTVDARTGEREMIVEANPTGGGSVSPNGTYVTWWNGEKKGWFAHNIETGKQTNLSKALPHPVYNELDDRPAHPRPYGSAGWTDDDAAFLIYDRYDIWAVDPAGFWPPTCVTEGKGREMGVRFRYVRLDREEETIDPAAPMLLSAFHLTEKSGGFFRDRVRDGGEPEEIVMLDERLSSLNKAEDASAVIFTRQTFEMFPDLWTSTLSDDLELGEMTRLTDANPQQSEYTWGTAELHEWTSLDGHKLQGILYKPDGFDADKQYPMMVYFYERLSDRLHSYVRPAPGSSSINTSFYVSRGYLVFQPDIPYREGYPGQSAVNAILPGVTSLIEAGFVDPERIGVQGHSWGGYQSAFLVTVTDMFAACESGAPVSNMTSAYGGIRWGSGLVRQFQYERTQSRIGGTLWERPTQYIENSPLFRADKINTPLLILHNDEDGAVPWYQGIELFAAMRRLGKPAWMFNYNGEAHGLRQAHNRKDWTIRMQQFFDHYLMDAPPPVWLVEGVPAVEKGRTLGLDLIEADKE
jgi:acetyl esterase/lipase